MDFNNGFTDLTGFPVVPGYQGGFLSDIPQIADTVAADGTVTSVVNDITNSAFNIRNTLAGNVLYPKQVSNNSASDDRLFIVRSRAAKPLYDNQGRDTYTTDRGPITTMKLLPGPDYDPLTAVKGARSNVDDDVNSLVAGRFVNFFITDVQTSFNEKTQITQTFGDNEVVYHFGRQPIIFNISGLLFDSLENDWFSKFLTLYAGVLRGTQLAKTFSLVEITFPNMIVKGTFSGLSISQNSQRDTDIPFQMQLIVKDVLPLPVPIVHGTASNLRGTLIDWNATRQGVAGYSLSTGGLGGGFMEGAATTFGVLGDVGRTVSGLASGFGATTDGLGSIAGVLSGSAVTSPLTSFRTNIFSPVYGVISSITKIVKSVTGTITSIVSSFTNPVNQVLRDIQSVTAQATGVINLVENSVNQVVSIPSRTLTNLGNTIRSLNNTAGAITRVPETISESFRRLNGAGRIKQGSYVLGSGSSGKNKSAILSSGAPYVPSKAYRL